MKKLLLPLMLLIALQLCLTGCSLTEDSEKDTSEQSNLGVDSSSYNFTKDLTDNMFYVVHDGIYYPLYSYLENEDAEDDLDIEDQVVASKMMFYTSENETNIPTLYKGDKIIYYSSTNLLDYITWERYFDMGYTIGVNNLSSTTSGRICIDKEETDDYTVLPDSELFELEREEASQLLFDKIGDTRLTKDMIDNGVIMGLKKDKEYDVDVYTGTYYKHYTVPANYHTFHAYELYASIEYDTMQDYLYEIKIPDYLLSGYYNINDLGLVRYVADDTKYDNNTNFNEPLLYQSDGEFDEDNTEAYTYTYTPPYCYSDYPELNFYHTDLVDAFGYISNNDLELESDAIDEAVNTTTIKESVVNEYTLHLPKNTSCSIEINSPEKTGELTLTYDNGTTKKATYDYFDKVYLLEVDGDDSDVTLSIEGFYSGYDVKLKNVQLINKSNAKESEE